MDFQSELQLKSLMEKISSGSNLRKQGGLVMCVRI